MSPRLLHHWMALLVAATFLPAYGQTGTPAVGSTENSTVNAAPPATAAAPTNAGPTMTPGGGTGGPRLATYTVGPGDTLRVVSHKFNCSISALKKLNHLKQSRLKPGQVLQLPPSQGPRSAALRRTAPSPHLEAVENTDPNSLQPGSASASQIPSTSKPLLHGKVLATNSRKSKSRGALAAQPVQDFDIPPSTFASCPSPPHTASAEGNQLIAPYPPSAFPLTPQSVPAAPAPLPDLVPTAMGQSSPTLTSPSPIQGSKSIARTQNPPVPSTALPVSSAPPGNVSASRPAPSSKSFASSIADFFGDHGSTASESGEWGNRFLVETRNLAGHGIGYDQSWRPDGETHKWAMDCSNTTRYLYQVTAGIQLPRTASDQYYYLHLQDKAWDVPMTTRGFADCTFLRNNLKPGDLLFWENTYRPERQPPITHVMIFLGRNERGQWIMAGSQSSRGGLYNRHRSGPDVYVFDPTRPTGGYSTWMGLVRHTGRFCAYGRPLEADVKKLSVAADD